MLMYIHTNAFFFSGLFVDVQHPYLAASPDGVLADEFAVLEVKCPYSGREEKIKPGKNFPFLEERDGNFCLKRGHNYYYQCMGQMAICKKQRCYFVTYTFWTFSLRKLRLMKHFMPPCSHCWKIFTLNTICRLLFPRCNFVPFFYQIVVKIYEVHLLYQLSTKRIEM